MLHIAANGFVAVQSVNRKHSQHREIRHHDRPVKEFQMMNANERVVVQGVDELVAERGRTGQ
jgi:hypothetical protein